MTPRQPRSRTFQHGPIASSLILAAETARPARHLALPAHRVHERTRPKLVLNASIGPRCSVIIKGWQRSQAFVALRVCRFAAEPAAAWMCDMERKPCRSAGRSVHQRFTRIGLPKICWLFSPLKAFPTRLPCVNCTKAGSPRRQVEPACRHEICSCRNGYLSQKSYRL